MLSRPRLRLRASPAASSTRKCFVTAWRVTPEPAVRLAMDIGPAAPRRETRRKRVVSPSAAKTEAALLPSATAMALGRRLRKVFLDKPGLHLPAAFVGLERLGSALQRNLIEPRLRNLQQNAARGFL